MGRTPIERKFWRAGIRSIAGVDEVGRGCLAGPLVAAAVILPCPPWPKGPLLLSSIRDSKKLTARERERLYPLILEICIAWNIVVIDPQVIDAMNIFRASLKAMRDAVQGLSILPDLVLVDGPWSLGVQSNRREAPLRGRLHPALPVEGATRAPEINEKPLIHGDDLSATIGAASIVAKVTRDKMMESCGPRWPDFSFAAHKGYGTAAHLEEIRRHGLTPLHRRSFSPCQT